MTNATLPEPKATERRASSRCESPACQGTVAEIIHVTGAGDDEWCLALPDSAAEELYREITDMDNLMAEFREAQSSQATETDDEPSPKRKWMIKATEMGVLAPEADAPDTAASEPPKASLIQSQIAALDEQIRWYDDYDPSKILAAVSDDAQLREDILTAAKAKRLATLRARRQALQAKLREGSAQDGVKGSGIKPSDFSSRSSRREAGVVEIMVFSRPGRWYYIRKSTFQRLKTHHRAVRPIRKSRRIARVLENPKSSPKELMGKIRDDLKADAAKSPVGNIEVVFAEAKDSGHLLGEEHSTLTWNSSDGEAPPENGFQVSAEAHLMRYAMQASAGVNSFDLSTGEIDIGVKASASMALLEAEVKLAEVFIPDQAGWDCRFTFRNRNGELTDLPFGAFRLSGDVTLNCFAGGRASGEANARLNTGAATFLLSDKRRVQPDPGAGLSVSGNAFAGAEAGGAVSGKLCWVHPEEQFKTNADWQELVSIEAGATVAAGVGAGLDFELGVEGNDLLMKCSGRIVFGPGASGNFGTKINLESAWTMFKATMETLRSVDYEYLENISDELFLAWSRNLFLAVMDGCEDMAAWYNQPYSLLRRIWQNRAIQKSNAEILARKINNRDLDFIFRTKKENISLYEISPETLGMMCHTLTFTFVDSWEEEQETALNYLITHIGTWRKFHEVLQHMTEDGSKCNPIQSLERICSILDDGTDETDNQLTEFNNWIMTELGTDPNAPVPQTVAWTPTKGRKNWTRARERLMAYKNKYQDNSIIV
ncbi:hypothetical protein [Marinobacter sp. C2H3]|uniref:hypothetical protein n=1 Tax=Marinobacter sp. C2H3 TaxID=3119003 RepID=UPI00300EEDDF